MSETIYVGHDAKVSFQIFQGNGDTMDLTASGENLSRATFRLAGVLTDSSLAPERFDWSTKGSTGLLLIDLTGLAFPAGSHGARLVVYGPSWPEGVVVADGYPVRVGRKL